MGIKQRFIFHFLSCNLHVQKLLHLLVLAMMQNKEFPHISVIFQLSAKAHLPMSAKANLGSVYTRSDSSGSVPKM